MEAAIALSIYLLAVELVRSRTGRTTVVQRAPWLVAGPFGLLHGLGFAGALAEVGLPQGRYRWPCSHSTWASSWGSWPS